MALMVLLRLPTEEDLESCGGVEAHTFLEAFNNAAVSPFTARVGIEDGCIDLDGWKIRASDWFEVIE